MTEDQEAIAEIHESAMRAQSRQQMIGCTFVLGVLALFVLAVIGYWATH